MKHRLEASEEMLAADRGRDWLLLRRLGAFIGPHRYLLITATIFLLIALVLQLIRPIIVKEVIDVGIATKNFGLILQYAGAYVALVVVGMMTLFVQNYTLARFGQSVIFEIRNTVFRKILSLETKDFGAVNVGNLVTRVTNDTEALRTLYTEVVLKVGSSALQIIGIICFMFLLNVELAFVVLCLLPVFVGIILVYQKYARQAFRGVRTKLAASNSAVQEMLNFIVIIKSYVGEVLMERKYDKISREFLAAGLFEVKTFAIFRPIVDSLLFIAIIMVFTFTNVFDSVTEAGTVFAFLQYLDRLFQPIKEIAEKYNNLQSALAGAERLVPILQEPDGHAIEGITCPPEWHTIEEIRFDHVWFSYDDSENYALEDINLTITGGDYVGIAGPSGGGKSTLVSLLMGFYQPTKGAIYINGRDVRDYDPAMIRETMGFVFQDSHLFKGTIRENLALYDDTISQEAIETATRKAHLHDAIHNLESGYDTPVGYLGSWLSEGQKQLLSMGRALVKEKPILIFDEATANIDSHTEGLLQESIESIRGEKTIISIAHRLSTIQKADAIYVIQEGRIVEEGSFEELLEQRGHLYAMWHAD